MPGKTGVEAAQHIGGRAHLVFVTAFDKYAVQAFAQGALDYLVKPVEPARLAETVLRLQERLRAAQPALDTEALLQQLALVLSPASAPQPLALGARIGRNHRAAHRRSRTSTSCAPRRNTRRLPGATTRASRARP